MSGEKKKFLYDNLDSDESDDDDDNQEGGG